VASRFCHPDYEGIDIMRTLRGLVVTFAVLVLAGQAYGDAKADAEKLIVGKWETKQKLGDKEATATLDFSKDGKLGMKLTGPAEFELKGSYKVIDENTIEVTITFMDKTMTEKSKFKVSKDTLELSDKSGKTQKFTRK